MNNKSLLTIIAIALVGIFGIFAYQAIDGSSEDTLSENVGEAFEEVGDEIDDNTSG